ncbi:MAG: cellulose biosynthesis cyclic di-GMP-binding regulatory protein BcsB [Burkholderiaceae bacterium]|nr:cellulose biosynthesis cyclic di-GMP-binding regulatory protein BcsB [Burkholderiaceae bacterium]
MSGSKKIKTWLTAISLAVVAASTVAAPVERFQISEAEPTYRKNIVPSQAKNFALPQLIPGGRGGDLRMTGTNNRHYFNFTVRRDEIVSDASLILNYTPSPSLIPVWSQLNVYLNGQVQQSISIEKDEVGKHVTKRVELNPKMIKDSNQIELEFVGTYTQVCGSPLSDTLWLSLDEESFLNLNVQKIRVANELSFFPLPFVDTNAYRETVLPFVFPKSPDNDGKQAAGVLASWFGAKSAWRGSHFPVYYDQLPGEGHFVVFLTNDERPNFLKDFPKVDGPQVTIMDAPYSLYAKMLVVAGRHTDDLLLAARAIASGHSMMAGDTAKIHGFQELAPRQPYDAPNWIDTSRITYFHDLIEYSGQLSSKGHQPKPVHLSLNLPPDLFMFNKSYIDLDLRYRYTKPSQGVPSQMRLLVNDQLIDSYDLDPNKDQSGLVAHLPAVNSLKDLLNVRSIPTLVLTDNNTLTFDFQYSMSYSGGNADNCQTITLIPNQVNVDPASSIDFTGLYHFTELPDLRMFARSGFPFSKYADLSETTVVMEKDSPAEHVTTLLNTLGRIGAHTGLAAINVQVTDQHDAKTLSDREILVIGALPAAITEVNGENVHALLTNARRELNTPFNSDRSLVNGARTEAQTFTLVESRGGLGAVVAFESPFTEKRSVVAMLSDGDSGSRMLNDTIRAPGLFTQMKGSVSIVREGVLNSFNVGETYHVGHLPWYQRVWFAMLERPLLLVLSAIICALLIGSAIYGMMRLRIKMRGQ